MVLFSVKGFLGEVVFKSDLPGIVIEMGIYQSVQSEWNKVKLINSIVLNIKMDVHSFASCIIP